MSYNMQQAPPPSIGHIHQVATLEVQPPPGGRALSHVNSAHAAKVTPYHAFMPQHTIAVSKRSRTGYSGLQEQRQENHMQRLATMRPVSHQQPRSSLMHDGNQTIRPVGHQQQRPTNLNHRMNRRQGRPASKAKN